MRDSARSLQALVMALLALLLAAAPAHALVGSLVKTTTSTVNTVTSSPTTALAPVTQVVQPVTTPAAQTTSALVGYDPISPLVALLGGQGLLTTVEQTACPVVTDAAALLSTLGGGLIGNALSTLACRASTLEYRFYTRLRRPDGTTVTRNVAATLGVPTLLNVDDDVEPDLIGTITLTGVDSVGLVVDRVATETSTLPVAVEAVLHDPSRGSLGRDEIAFGYDARDDRAPGRFVLSTAIQTILQPSPQFDLKLSQTSPGNRIAIIGAIFDGPLDARQNPAELRLDYGNSPTTATISARIGGGATQVGLTTTPTGPLDVTGRIVQAIDEQRFAASVRDLPSAFSFSASQAGGVTHATVTSSARITKLSGSFTRVRTGGATEQIAQKTVLDLDDVPVGVDVRFSSAGGAITTTGGPIGHTTVGAANGEPVFITDKPAYLKLHQQGTLDSVAAAIPGLSSATFTLGDAPHVSAQIAPTPFFVRITQPGRTLGADILDLPAQFDIGLDVAGGRLDWDGHGAGIGRLVLAGDSTTPFFGRATKLRGTIEGIPAHAGVALTNEAGRSELSVDGGAIHRVELLASNGADELPAGADQGVVYRDISGGTYLVAARILELQRVSFASGDALSLSTHTAGGPFTLVAQTDAFSASGRIADLPARAGLGAALEDGRITYSGREEDGDPIGIDQLDLDVTGTSPLVARADHIRAHVERIPSDLQLDVASGGGGADVTASNPIGLVELVAANRPVAADDLPAGGEQGAKLTDLAGGEYVLGARIRDLRHLAASLGTPIHLTAETAGGPFGLRLHTDDLSGLLRIEDLPAKLDAALDLGAGKLTVASRDASGAPQRIGRISADLHAANAIFGRASDVAATIEGIPADLALDIAQDGQGARIEASEPIDLIEVVAANRPAQDGDLPANGEQGAKFVDLSGGEFVIGARLRQVSKLAGSFDDAVTVSARTAGGPFGIRVLNDDLDGLARIEDLPAQLEATFDVAGGKLSLSGRDAGGSPQGVALVHVALHGEHALFGRASDVDALIEDIPSDVSLDLAQSGGGVDLVADQPIGLIELVANDGAIPDPQALLPAAGAQGAIYRDTDAAFLISARARQLKQLTAQLAGKVTLRALTAGGPFDVHVESGEVTTEAVLHDLPADVTASFDPAGPAFDYAGKTADGAPAGIGLVTIDMVSAQPVFGRATCLSARIEDLADTVHLALTPDGAAGPSASVDASDPITRVEVLATDGAATFPAPLDDPAAQGAVLHDRAGEPYVAALRILDLEHMAFAFGQQIGVDARTAGGPFDVDVDTDALGLTGRIADLPAVANLGVDLDAGEITFDGADADGNPEGIDLLTLDGRLAQPFLGRGNRISARIERLPAHVTLGFSEDAGKASLHATEPIELVELFGWQDGNSQPVLGADQGALLHDRAGEPFELAARIRQLSDLSIDFADAMQLTTKTAGGLFSADVRTDTLTANALIDQLPTDLSLGLDLDGGKVTYAGSSTINRIYASIDSTQPVFMGADAFEVDLQQVPQAFEIGLGTDTGNIHLDADNPIGQIDVRAHSAGKAYPSLPAGEAGAVLDSRNDELALALRVFALKSLDVSLDPMSLETEMQGGRKFTVAADVPSGSSTLHLDGVIDKLPAKVKLALEDNAGNGSKLVLNGSAPIDFVHLGVRGLELLPGADKVDAELNTIPEQLSVALPETGTLARVESKNAAGVATAIGQLRLAASDGSKTLPAFVSDAQYNANPTNTGFRDRIEFDNSPGSFGVALRLTAAKVIDVDLDPIALTLEQDGARTRPVAIAATIPNSTAGQPATTVNGVLNKPSARTVLGVTVATGQPTRLNFSNAAPVGSLSLDAANLGTIPSASFSLANIPTSLSVCLDTTSACRPTASNRIPTALSNYSSFGGNPSQSATFGGGNRPYAAQVSMDFADNGSSGTSTAISSMVTLNASIKLKASDPPVTITNLRFHNLAMDLGQHATSPTFSFLGSNVPRIYMFIDSLGQRFVMNEIKYPPNIESFKIGTDTSPASATRRLVWLPGTKCTSSVFGVCITTGLDTRSTGSLDCAGQRNLTIKVLGLNVNLLDFLGLQILPVCS